MGSGLNLMGRAAFWSLFILHRQKRNIAHKILGHNLILHCFSAKIDTAPAGRVGTCPDAFGGVVPLTFAPYCTLLHKGGAGAYTEGGLRWY